MASEPLAFKGLAGPTIPAVFAFHCRPNLSEPGHIRASIHEVPSIHKRVDVAKAILDRYVGTYHVAPGFDLKIVLKATGYSRKVRIRRNSR
jgi:hypothetical protein